MQQRWSSRGMTVEELPTLKNYFVNNSLIFNFKIVCKSHLNPRTFFDAPNIIRASSKTQKPVIKHFTNPTKLTQHFHARINDPCNNFSVMLSKFRLVCEVSGQGNTYLTAYGYYF